MKSILFTLTLGLLSVANASEKLSATCEQNITNAVYDRFGRYDETFSVVGYKVIYNNYYSGLAVVRTSDEVEPRDVLVSLSQTKSTCEVQYKEVLADGSVSDLDDSLIELSQDPQKISTNYQEISGKILSVTVGELDPMVVGDACLIEVQTDKETIGLLTEYYECEDENNALKQGVSIQSLLHKRDQVRSKEELKVLSSASKANRFVKVPYAEIKVK